MFGLLDLDKFRIMFGVRARIRYRIRVRVSVTVRFVVAPFGFGLKARG
jgi:hypothetical protein